jgi:hypothetical protein
MQSAPNNIKYIYNLQRLNKKSTGTSKRRFWALLVRVRMKHFGRDNTFKRYSF